MSIRRIIAVIIIYILVVAAWGILGTAMAVRSDAMSMGLDQEVRQLWGQPLVQQGPSFKRMKEGDKRGALMVPEKSDIDVTLALEHRRKGLLWYPTYECSFTSSYVVLNPTDHMQSVQFHFPFPEASGTYDAFSITRDAQSIAMAVDTRVGLQHVFELKPGEQTVIGITYKTRGIEEWSYQINKEIGRVKDFTLQVATNFTNYDYIGGTMSADTVQEHEQGVRLTWATTDRITQQHIGLKMPTRLNPGPLSSRMTFFAPVCLVFFFSLVAAISIVKKINIHPMHFLFVAAGFFAFHLLFAYLVDLVNVHVAFAISTATTLLLVTSYMSAALKGAFPKLVAIGGQLFFLVLFSYSFFLEGTTGLTVAIGSVLTLAVIMRLTADVDWQEFFARKPVLGRRKGLEADYNEG